MSTRKLLVMLLVLTLALLTTSCREQGQVNMSDESQAHKDQLIVIGFSQLGAESDWRSANTESMKSTFSAENGYELIFDDGQQNQENQITAIRRFIQQEVDYIVLAPVTEEGWDTVLQEAKDAGIPVVIVDRMVNVSDPGLFTCWVGSDFELEGKKATEWLHQYTLAKNIAPEDIHIVNIQGTIGASAQIGRTKGLKDASKLYGWELLAEASGDFTQAKGREVMSDFLSLYSEINVVYCENDNEAFGAIEAIEAVGKKVGSDLAAGEIMVVSFDGVNQEAIDDVLNGKIACITECNPLHGPRVEAIIRTLIAGEEPDKFEYVDEDIFTADDIIAEITVDGTVYEVTIISEEGVSANP